MMQLHIREALRGVVATGCIRGGVHWGKFLAEDLLHPICIGRRKAVCHFANVRSCAIAEEVREDFQMLTEIPPPGELVHADFLAVRPAQMMQEAAEIELLTRVAAGDMDAFGTLYDRFAGPMFSLAIQILNDGAAAEDVVQEACVQMWEKAATYNAALGKPLTWAVTLVRNRAIDRLRASARRHKLAEALANELEPFDPGQPGAADELIGGETAAAIRAALVRVPAEQRQAIEMAYFVGLSQTEIATALGLPLGTVKARIRRGMIAMREFLDVN